MSYSVPPLGGQFFEPLPAITRAMVKLPSIVADLATVALMYWWGRRWSNRRAAALIAALYTLSPPIWINSAWWGQADTLLMFPLVAALMLLDRAKGRWSWLLWAIALATKPQAIVLLPVLAVLSARRYGCRGVLQGGGITLAVLTAAALPLLVAGQGEALYNAAFTSVGRFPSVTNGAYNVGYLLTGRTQTDDTNLWLDLISYRLFGLCLLSAATLLICVALLRRRDMLARLLAASLTALAFVLLPTQIHERYLFLPLAFLVLCICIDRAYLLPYLLLMASATINIFGDLSGFWPAAATAIRASPLPYVLAIGNSGLLLVLLWRLALPAPENPRQMI
jgi:Gpi18-like mannosyltransferase